METTNKPARKRYDEAFKRSAVDLLMNGGKPLKQIARELGLTPITLRGWRKKLTPAPATPARTPDELQAQVRELQKELLRVKTQRDILKKTLGILSADPNNDSNA